MKRVNITLGTAGHIDHGKTALIKNLTGCDTDRLKEEKERSMSIELGYAPCRIADTQVGIVDVPGHENFIKTMVAGANGMDAVILVVAADDGVMPQTREHLEILSLLGIQRGIVALTKIDRVTPEQRADVCDKVVAFLRGTFLEGAPILPVSNVTGKGFDRFLEAVWTLVQTTTPKRIDGVFRMPLERAFSAQGYGTVVTGIPVAGAARVGDEVVLLPHDFTGRIRRIEVYGQDSQIVMAGQCAAINVAHWDYRMIRRGDTLVVPGCFSPAEWFVCSLKLLPRDKLRLKSGSEVKFHTGTTEAIALFYPLQGGHMEGGDEGLVQVRTKTPVVAGPSDHFLLRTPSPARTVGGGRIVEAVDRRLKGNRPQMAEDLQTRAEAVLDEHRFVEYCVRRAADVAVGESALAFRTKIPIGRLREILGELVLQRKILVLGTGLYLHGDTATDASERILDLVNGFHRQSPESPGLPVELLRRSMSVDKVVLDDVLARLKGDGRLVERSQRLALPEHRSVFQDDETRLFDVIESLFRDKGFCPPAPEEVVRQTGVPQKKVEKILGLLCEHERLVRVEGSLLFHREAVDRARDILAAHFRKEGRLESVQFKYLLNTTRKFAIPLLDYLDRIGITRRVGNTRYPKSLPPESE